jgi:hypothetical protein
MTQTLSATGLRGQMTHEIEVLLCCGRLHLTPDQVNQLQDWVEGSVDCPLDWPTILRLAAQHSLMPLLYRHLSKHCGQAIPTAVLTQCKDRYDKNFQANLRLTSELLKLAQDFAHQNIPVLCYKGPVLAQMAYGNLALREFTDLDLLIHEADVLRATRLLEQQGFSPHYALSDTQVCTYAKTYNEHAFWHEAKQFCADLHWSILPRYSSFSPNSSFLWPAREQFIFASQTVETLSREHLLLFLCAHGAKHNWSHLCWICDLDALLQASPTLDWQKVQTDMGHLGTPRMLYLGLYLTHHLLGTSLPTDILNAIQADTIIPALAIQVQQQLFSPSLTALRLQQDRLIYLKTFQSWKDILWFWVSIILIPTPLEWQIIALPRTLGWLYYPIRILRLLLRRLGFRKENH